MITALCGGVGGSKLALGLYRAAPPDSLTLIVNTADDLTIWGLHVSPDLDTATYTLAGLAGREAGWGIEGDTFAVLEMMGRYGLPDWFRIGDRDLATHLFRSNLLASGLGLTAATHRIVQQLGVRARILPMTDAQVATRLQAGDERLEFQEYFVHRRHQVPIEAVHYDGIEKARLDEATRHAVMGAEVVVVVNSNPVVSILPIVAVPGMEEALRDTTAPRVAVSPMLGQGSVTGPAGVLMSVLDLPPTSLGVAMAYRHIIDGIVIDRQDADQRLAIEALGIQVLESNTVMRDEQDRIRLAEETLHFARGLR